ncbi:MAG TPA: nickel pincer cofactor biosynthesis protein LarC [Haliangiales bacterium]|nr:nickel pincer cofactor biosynthesis protein LarC [Haliangiales bacterium]
MQGTHLHFDCPAGVAGDMMLGALLDMGVPETVVREALGRLPIGGFEVKVEKTTRGALVGTDVRVEVQAEQSADGHGHGHGHGHEEGAHRHYGQIRTIVHGATDGRTRELALAIFDLIAVAEAKLHGVAVDDVAFHEVGAVDSIVDIVGTAAALAWLAPASVSSTPLPLGHGTVATAHGLLPVPAPATLEICRAAGVPTSDGGAAFELTTPTGAAVMAAIVQSWGPMPALRVRAIGWGAGDRQMADRPNMLRAVVGEAVSGGDSVVEVEANLDDMSPELCEHVAERLFAAGAVDVWWTPVVMKKSRPALILGALAPIGRREDVIATILRETTTLGVRFADVARRTLERRVEEVDTPWGRVSVKVGLLGGVVVNVAPEYESCRALARHHGVPLKDVFAAAIAEMAKRR